MSDDGLSDQGLSDQGLSDQGLYVPVHPVRVLTAAALFDGHDAAINIMRRILQSQGAEVIHLGHNRSVDEVATAAIQEDVHAIAISSYQGGHVEYFEYLVKLLNERGAGHIRVLGPAYPGRDQVRRVGAPIGGAYDRVAIGGRDGFSERRDE